MGMGIAKYRGKPCKNGSHFQHDGGYFYGPGEPDPGIHWRSITSRDCYSPTYRCFTEGYNLKQHLLDWKDRDGRWRASRKMWPIVGHTDIDHELFLAVMEIKHNGGGNE